MHLYLPRRKRRATAATLTVLLALGTTPASSSAWDFVYGEPSTPTVTNLSSYGGVAVGDDGSTYLAGAFSGSFQGLDVGPNAVSGFLQKLRPDGTSAWAVEVGTGFFTAAGVEPGRKRVIVDPGGSIVVVEVERNLAWTVSPDGIVEGFATLGNAPGATVTALEPQPHPDGGFLAASPSPSCNGAIPSVLSRYAADLSLVWSYDFSEIQNCDELWQGSVVPVSDGSIWVVGTLYTPKPWDPGSAATAMVHIAPDGSKIASILHYDFIGPFWAWASDSTLWLDVNKPALPIPQARVALSAADGRVLSTAPMVYPTPSGLFPGSTLSCNYFEPLSYRPMLTGDRIVAEGRCYYQTATTVKLLGRVVIAYAVGDASGALTPLWWRYPPAGTTVRDFEVGPYGDVVIAGSTSTAGAFLGGGSVAALGIQATPTLVAAAAQNPNGSLWRGKRAAGSVLELKVTGRGGVTDDATAVALNVTAVAPAASGYVTVYPCGASRPKAANLTFTAGATVPVAAIAQVGRGGRLCVYTSQSVHLVVDMNGYFPAGSPFEPLAPARLLDTRQPAGTTIDDRFAATGRIQAGSVVELAVTGRGGVATGAATVALNVTATNAASSGYVTVYPCGTSRPNAANLSFSAGRNVANLAVTAVGTGGKVCLFSSSAVDLIADVSGYFPPGDDYVALTPARLLETRSTSTPTTDGLYWKIGRVAAGATLQLPVAGRGGVASEALAAVLNVTVTSAQATGYLTVYPCGSARPKAAHLNYSSGATVANAVIAKLGSAGAVCLYTTSAAQVIVDVAGYFPTSTTFVPLVPFRALDTR